MMDLTVLDPPRCAAVLTLLPVGSGVSHLLHQFPAVPALYRAEQSSSACGLEGLGGRGAVDFRNRNAASYLVGVDFGVEPEYREARHTKPGIVR